MKTVYIPPLVNSNPIAFNFHICFKNTPHLYSFTGEEQPDNELDFGRDSLDYSYDHLKEIDPVAANRIHPNNHRRVRMPT